MATTVIAERIGWPGGRTVLQERVAELRPLFLPADPVAPGPGSIPRGMSGSGCDQVGPGRAGRSCAPSQSAVPLSLRTEERDEGRRAC